MTPRDVRRLARRMLPPGVHFVDCAVADALSADGSRKGRYQLAIAAGVDVFEARRAAHALLARLGLKPGALAVEARLFTEPQRLEKPEPS